MVGLSGMAAGCRLQRRALPEHTYVLQLPPAEPLPTASAPNAALLVRPLTVAAPFASRSFVIRRGESEYAVDAYNAFLMSPGVLLTDAFAGWIRGLGRFAVVTTGGSRIDPTHALEGEVTELYGDYRNPDHAEAHLDIHLRLFHPLDGRNSTLHWQRSLRKAIPLPRAGAEELVAGWNKALAEICREITPSLNDAL
jgi:ABC-type uncharacterized transport system auxiliary subunit